MALSVSQYICPKSIIFKKKIKITKFEHFTVRKLFFKFYSDFRTILVLQIPKIHYLVVSTRNVTFNPQTKIVLHLGPLEILSQIYFFKFGIRNVIGS